MPAAQYRVIANNPAAASENRIHSDDVARRHGFRGGLVPGVTVYGYLVHALVDGLGPDWVATGRASVRFRQPCYEGDELVTTLHEDGTIEVACADSVCVTGHASTVRAGDPRPLAPDVPAGDPPPAPSERPPASEESLAPGTVLGTIGLATDQAAVQAYMDKIGDADPMYLGRGWLHPGMLLEGANRVLSANVVLPLWLHVGSDVTHLRPVRTGEELEVRACVADGWEKKGHRFATIDVSWQAGTEPVARAAHTVIWQLAGEDRPG